MSVIIDQHFQKVLKSKLNVNIFINNSVTYLKLSISSYRGLYQDWLYSFTVKV